MKKKKRINKMDGNSLDNIYINEKQLSKILKEVDSIHQNQTKEIKNTLIKLNDDNTEQEKVNDGFSKFVRWLLTILFCGFGIFMILGIIISIENLWKDNFINDLAIIILFIISICSIVLGISIHKIKNRNYLISVFSALVAFTALIVALIK